LADILYIFSILLIYIETLLQIFSLGWNIVGTVWLVSAMESAQYVNNSLSTYCDKSTFNCFYIFTPIQCAVCVISSCTFVIICWRNKY
jgi:hypothetical protein